MTMTNKPEKTAEEIQAEQELAEQLATEIDPDEDDDDVESLKKKLKTATFQKEHWRGKAQKATTEGKPEVKKPEAEAPAKGDNLSSMDVIALTRADIHNDDIQEVVDYAKYKNISVSEALNSPTIKAVIAQNTEFRKTAEATNTSAAKKTVTKVSDQKLQENLSKGDVPEPGSSDAEALFWARRGGKR